jgi:hypothetical protein
MVSNQELGGRNSTRTGKNEEQRRDFALRKRAAFLFFSLAFHYAKQQLNMPTMVLSHRTCPRPARPVRARRLGAQGKSHDAAMCVPRLPQPGAHGVHAID